MPILLATSRTSKSEASLTYAFLAPSGLIKVLTLATSTSYIFLTAALIFGLFALISTMKTRVLLSSIFFMADSVVNGCLIVENWSSLGEAADDLVGHFGFLANLRVFGLLKWTEVLIFFFLKLFLPLRAALAAVLALDIFCRFLYLLDNRNRTQKWDESPCTLR